MTKQLQVIRELIRENKLDEALIGVRNIVNDATCLGKIDILIARKKRIDDQIHKGLISFEDFSKEENRISDALLSILNDLQKEKTDSKIKEHSDQFSSKKGDSILQSENENLNLDALVKGCGALILLGLMIFGGCSIYKNLRLYFKSDYEKRNNIVALIKRDSVLIGIWDIKFETELFSNGKMFLVNGESEFKSNKQFIHYITAKWVKSSKFNLNESYDLVIGGGSINGIWDINATKGIWEEYRDSCSVKETFNISINENHINCEFIKDGIFGFKGDKEKIKAFNSKMIIYESINYSNGVKGTLTMTKK